MNCALLVLKEPGGCVYLFFSVNGSGHFCGMAQMASPVDYNCNSSVWSQDKWKGQFRVRWIYVKDVPNVQLRHIRLENNENKPVTNSRDTQEVPHAKGQQVLRILHTYRYSNNLTRFIISRLYIISVIIERVTIVLLKNPIEI